MEVKIIIITILLMIIMGANTHGYIQAKSVNSTYEDVLLITNNQSSVSLQIGEYFHNMRNVSYRFNISTPEVETITCETFTNDIRTPIETYITNNNLEDVINYFVTTKGVPLRISDGQSSVDSELTLILTSRTAYICVPGSRSNNPYYERYNNFTNVYYDMYITTRLTGYDYNNVTALLDRGVFDWENIKYVLDQDPGNYVAGNGWMASANTNINNKGQLTKFDETETYLKNQLNVFGYCSWGSNDGNVNSIESIPNNQWRDGALAETFVSTSARSFNYPPSYGQSLIADLIDEGVTGVSGNVYEPYLSGSTHPEIVFPRYIDGFNLAESYYMANDYLSWMKVIVGDPKLKVEFREQNWTYSGSGNFVIDLDMEGETVSGNIDLGNNNLVFLNEGLITFKDINIKTSSMSLGTSQTLSIGSNSTISITG